MRIYPDIYIWTKRGIFFEKISGEKKGDKMAYDLEELKRVVEDTEKFLVQPNTTLTEICSFYV